MPETDLIKLRDGEVVLYRRGDSPKWQARFRTPDQKWHRISTKRVRIDDAKVVACESYDRARFRDAEGFIAVSRRFRDVAKLSIHQMDQATEAGRGKVVFKDYKQVIEKYLIPYFGSTHIDKIDVPKMQQFEAWRLQQMKKAPAASTILNHNAALHRVFDTALAEGWVKQQQIPPFKVFGKKAQRRPAFTLQEWNKITANLRHWVNKTPYPKAMHMRELLWDYVLMLANTGIRTGKEALNLKWSQIRWHTTKDKQRYLAITVDGKTGKRELIARHGSVAVLERIKSRFCDLNKMPLDELLKAKVDQYVFRLRDTKDKEGKTIAGKRTNNLRKTFFDFLTEHGLLKDPHGHDRTLYSIRHTYATLRLSDGELTTHQLSKQMGTSTAMMDKHYSHIETTMIAEQLAGKRFDKKLPPKRGTKRQTKFDEK